MQRSLFKNPFKNVAFQVTKQNGFLPISNPVYNLAPKFSPVTQLLKDLPVYLPDGSNGLLGKGEFGNTVKKDLPLIDITDQDVADPMVAACLFGSYAHLAASYLLEPCHLKIIETGNTYGRGRDHVPKNLALPLAKLSSAVKYNKLLFDYAHGYGLNNWKLIQAPDKYRGGRLASHPSPPAGIEVQNMNTIRQFHGGTDEKGFVLVHVEINAKTPRLVESIENIFHGMERKNNFATATGLEQLLAFFLKIQFSFGNMWNVSKPKNYLKFRTFIMGVKGNEGTIFPKGVTYEGLNEPPRHERGETGAQDSVIPTLDSLFGIDYPVNSLTEYLFELREYRPPNHQAYIDWVRKTSEELGFIRAIRSGQNQQLTFLAYHCLNYIKVFRQMHWNMTKSYIIANTKHPRATGGTPITTWLPNQFLAVMENMKKIGDVVKQDQLKESHRTKFREMQQQTEEELKELLAQVRQMQEAFQNCEQEVKQWEKRILN